MPFFIGDGKGRGRDAKVTIDQRLAVDSVTHPGKFRSTVTGFGFSLVTSTTADTLTVTDTGGYIVYMENDSTDQMLVIDRVVASASLATNIVVFERNASIATPTNTNTYTPVNMNFGSSNAAEGTFYTWNETGNGMTTVTAGSEFFVTQLGVGTTTIHFDQGIHLDTDDTFTIRAEGVGSTPEMAFTVFFHYVPDNLREDFRQ